MSLICSYLLPSFNLVTLEKKFLLRIYWRLFVFWYLKVCVLRKFTQHTMHWDKTQILKKFPSYNINVTKIVLFFSWWAPTPTVLFLICDMSWNTRFVSLRLCVGLYHFQMIPIYIFDRQNAWTLTLKRHNSFQN